MTPADLRAIRHGLGLSARAMARALNLPATDGGRSIRRWEAGSRKPGGPVLLLYRLYASRVIKPPD